MMWQMWTAFGIMLGNIMGVAFMGLPDNLSWRLMLGSTVVLPLIVCAQVYLCPESPRWLIEHNKINKAYEAFRILRPSDLQAARDLYYAYVGVQLEREVNKGKNFFTMFLELFTIPRNARATLATWIVMFLQQVSHETSGQFSLMNVRGGLCQHASQQALIGQVAFSPPALRMSTLAPGTHL